MIECENYEGKTRPPDADYLGNLFAGTAGEEAGETDQPVCSYAAEEDLMPLRRDHFLRSEFDGLGGVGCIGEDVCVANEDGHYEERAGEVAEKGDSPVFEHLEDGGATVES